MAAKGINKLVRKIGAARQVWLASTVSVARLEVGVIETVGVHRVRQAAGMLGMCHIAAAATAVHS